jgi:hypothetical protein
MGNGREVVSRSEKLKKYSDVGFIELTKGG